MPEKKNAEKIFAIPHFHFDLEWWKTEDEYSVDVDAVIARALDMLEKFPEFKYTLDQALAVRPFWEQHPDKRDLMRRLVAEGRIELVGGTLAAPDENIPTGEALIRNFVHGLRFFENEMGGKVETAWEIDEFGHPEQMAQLFAKSGFRQFVFARGVAASQLGAHPSDFILESPDGTKLLSHWLCSHYTGFVPMFKSKAMNRAAFRRELSAKEKYESERAATGSLMIPFGMDFQAPSEEWIGFIDKWNAGGNTPVEFSLPREFFAAMRQAAPDLPTLRDELNPIFTGCYESREKVKMFCRKSQHAALEAEKFAAIAWAAGWAAWPAEKFDSAWENILKNDFHDVVCGTGTDKVYVNTLRRYEAALKVIDSVRLHSINIIAKRADTSSGAGKPVVVFNSLNHERRDVASLPLPAGVNPGKAAIADAEGNDIPCQVSGNDVIFMADAPPVGYAVYYLREAKKAASKKENDGAPFKVDGLVFENEHLRVSLDPKTGGLYSLFHKPTGREALDTTQCFGNELLVEEDVGNLWTIHKTGREWRARDYSVKIRVAECGPVRLVVEVAGPHKAMNRRQEIVLHAGSDRVDFNTHINFGGKDMRVRALFGTPGGQAVFETPFSATRRGDGHHCAQNWADISGKDGGLALFNAGSPGHEVEGGVLSIGLLRSISVLPAALPLFILKNLPGVIESAGKAAMHYLGGMGMGMSEWDTHKYHGLTLREWASEGSLPAGGGFPISADHVLPLLKFYKRSLAWERGEHSFHYAALPHAGDFRAATLPARGLAFNTPLLAVAAERSKGELPPRHSFLDTGPDPAAILTSLKKSDKSDTLAARIYDAHGDGADVRLWPWKPISKCEKTNLVESETYGSVKTRTGAARDRLSPWEIATYRVELKK